MECDLSKSLIREGSVRRIWHQRVNLGPCWSARQVRMSFTCTLYDISIACICMYVCRTINENCMSHADLGEYNALDESCDIPGHLRGALNTYNRCKPNKYSIKTWSLCSSDNGYLYCFFIHDPRKGRTSKSDPGMLVLLGVGQFEAVTLALGRMSPANSFLMGDRAFITIRMARYVIDSL